MRIALITHNWPFKEGEGASAAGLFVSSFAHTLRDAGNEVFVFTSQRGGIDGESGLALQGLKVKWFPWKGDKLLGHLNIFNPKEMTLLLRYLHNGQRELLDYVKEKNIEYCLAFWAFPAGYFARLVKNKLGIPYAVWALGSDIWTYSKWPIARKIIKRVLISADHVYADGFKLCEDVRALSKVECAFLPSTRDLPQCTTCHCEGQGPEAISKFLYIGRFEKAKGVDLLFDAIRGLKQRTSDFHVFAFGGGRLHKEIETKLSQWSLDREVTLGGYINVEEAAKFLYNCDCMIIPSRKESIPIIYSDGLKAGIDMITSDAGDFGRLYREHHYGKIFPSGDVNALEEALFSFIAERRQRKKKYAPPKELLDLFDQKKIVSQFLKNIGRKP